MPTAPPDSVFPTPAPEIGLGDLDIMDQWLTFMEDPPDLGDKFDMEDEDAGCHFDNLLEEMEGDEPWDKDWNHWIRLDLDLPYIDSNYYL